MNETVNPVTPTSPSGIRLLAAIYGVCCYLVFLVTFLYAIGFVSNLWVPKSIDSGPTGTLAEAMAIDLLLLGLFATQHSVMARPAFKRWWTQLVPQPVERSTYVLASSLALLLLYWQWRPMTDIVWEVRQPMVRAVIWSMSALGWLIVLVATFLIDHFDLFGLRQAVLYAVGRPYSSAQFRTPALYQVVRHPIMLGFLIAFWSTPVMTLGHALFAIMTTAYIFVGVSLEERDLRIHFGVQYENYRRRVPGLIPWLGNLGRSQ